MFFITLLNFIDEDQFSPSNDFNLRLEKETVWILINWLYGPHEIEDLFLLIDHNIILLLLKKIDQTEDKERLDSYIQCLANLVGEKD